MRTPSVSEFQVAALEFRTFSSRPEPVTGRDLPIVRSLLLRLLFHITAVRHHPHSFEFDGRTLSREQHTRACERFQGFPFDEYRLVFDPHDFEGDEPVTAMLSTDLADIYCDLAEGLDNWSKGHLEEACFDWAQSYTLHWNRHAVSALSAIEHYLIANPGI